jgi:nucleoid-associated protein YgaU
VGIEHEGKATDLWSEAMYQASGELIAAVCCRHNIPIDYKHIIPHRAIRADKTCPGNGVDLSKLLAIAQAYAKCGEGKKPSGPRTHTVVAGDTLSLIAKAYLGDAALYRSIISANNLTSTNIKVGQVLVIPE